LRLDENSITDHGASALAESLKVNQKLVKLDLACNFIRDGGATALAESLRFNEGLMELHLARNEITDKGASELVEALKANKRLLKLDLQENHIQAFEEKWLGMIDEELNKRETDSIGDSALGG